VLFSFLLKNGRAKPAGVSRQLKTHKAGTNDCPYYIMMSMQEMGYHKVFTGLNDKTF